ncbi:hypothetical protein LOK74_12840 [Brevibacillus humidisoli]|nr:hypothetical protein [Brevibacillus humidisoli]UFJ38970.1 hypothetical protein LOK74_12840 [Brevibacillus humidisoli]
MKRLKANRSGKPDYLAFQNIKRVEGGQAPQFASIEPKEQESWRNLKRLA